MKQRRNCSAEGRRWNLWESSLHLASARTKKQAKNLQNLPPSLRSGQMNSQRAPLRLLNPSVTAGRSHRALRDTVDGKSCWQNGQSQGQAVFDHVNQLAKTFKQHEKSVLQKAAEKYGLDPNLAQKMAAKNLSNVIALAQVLAA